jgi:hypothetical protein
MPDERICSCGHPVAHHITVTDATMSWYAAYLVPLTILCCEACDPDEGVHEIE